MGTTIKNSPHMTMTTTTIMTTASMRLSKSP